MLVFFLQTLENMEIQFTTKANFNMTGRPQYVADSPLGGRCDLGDLVGSEAADADHGSAEDYWPRIPLSYGPPPTHLENAVKEGSCAPVSWLVEAC